jgi:hypothetical protein
MAVAARRETVAALSCQTCSYGVWDMHSTVECLLRRKLTGRFVSKAELHQVLLSGNSNFNQPQIVNFPKAALRNIPLSTHCRTSIFPEAEVQRPKSPASRGFSREVRCIAGLANMGF